MQDASETVQSLERSIIITIPSKEINQEAEKKLKTLTQSVKIAGFRSGKVPKSLIQKRFGAEIQNEIIEDLIKFNLNKIIREEKLRLISEPKLEIITNDEALQNGDLKFKVIFELYPEINLSALNEIVIIKPELIVEDSDIDKIINKLRRQNQTWNLVNDQPAKNGDRVKIDFTSKLIDGSDYSGNTGNDVVIVLGEKTFITGFEHNLIGAISGETRAAEVTFPTEYYNSELAGKTAVFNINVKSVEIPKLPEIDEKFIYGFGIAEGTMDAMRKEVRASTERTFNKNVWQILKNQVMEVLYNKNKSIEIPQKLLNSEITRLHNLSISGLTDSTIENQARYNIVLGLIINEIAINQNIRINQARVRNYIKDLAVDYENAQEMEQQYLTDNNQLKEIEAVVIEDMVIEWVLTQVQIKKDQKSFSELENISNYHTVNQNNDV